MTLVRMLVRDVRVGAPYVRPYLIAALLLGAVHGIAAAGEFVYRGFDLATCTLGDYLGFTFTFSTPLDLWMLIQGRPLSINFPWFFSFAVLFAATLDYPREDLLGAGYRGIVASGSRWSWWLAKCLWVCAVALVFWVLLFAGIALVAQILGSPLSLQMTEQTARIIQTLLDPYMIGMSLAPLMLLCVPVCAALMLVQLAVSVRAERMGGYVLSMGVLFASTMVQHPLLLGNYLITGRNAGAYVDGMRLSDGLALSLAVAWAAVAVGGLLVSRMTIYGGVRDE